MNDPPMSVTPGAPARDGYVEAAGIRFHVRRLGASSALPAIVLECGGGSIAAHWTWIEEALAKHTLVISYDRAGMGHSRPAPADAGVEAAMGRLHQLLSAAAVPRPYILVGHSLGGLYARYAASQRWPGLVGIVLVDATASAELPFPLSHRLLISLISSTYAVAARLRLLPVLRALLARPDKSGLPPDVEAAARALEPDHHQAARKEIAQLDRVRRTVSAHPLGPDMPVLAITAGYRGAPKGAGGPPPPTVFAAAFARQHKDLAAASSQGRHVLMSQATHSSLLTNREHAYLVAQEILAFAARLSAV